MTFILLWGTNLPETNASKYERVKDAQKKGVRTIVVDPRPIQLAKEAALWLRIRPGTDCALALGMIKIIVANGWYDKKFISEWTVGFDALKARAAAYTAEKVAEITPDPRPGHPQGRRNVFHRRVLGYLHFYRRHHGWQLGCYAAPHGFLGSADRSY